MKADTTLTIKLPKKLRDEAKRVAHELGVPMTTVLQAELKRLVRERQLTLEAPCPYPSHAPNAETKHALRNGHRKLRGDRVFGTPEELAAYFRSI